MGNTHLAAVLRRPRVRIALTVAIAGGATALLMPPATAAPDPCAASQVARTVGTVANNTGVYLDANPEANEELTAIAQQDAGPQSLVALKTFFDANPDVAADMKNIQKPLTTLSTRCKLPIGLPQVMGFMQAAQQGGGLPAQVSLPGVGTGAAGTTVPAGTGPRPGPNVAPSTGN